VVEDVFEFLANTFNTSVMAVTQLFLSTVLSSNPWFENVRVEVSTARGDLLCSARLVQSFTESLDRAMLSGETITLHFQYEILDSETEDPIHRGEVVHGFRYTVLDDRYYVLRSERGELEEFFSFVEAKQQYIQVQNISVADPGLLESGHSYILRLIAFVDPVKMPEMSETVNLMLLWVSVKPTYVSEPFTLQTTG